MQRLSFVLSDTLSALPAQGPNQAQAGEIEGRFAIRGRTESCGQGPWRLYCGHRARKQTASLLRVAESAREAQADRRIKMIRVVECQPGRAWTGKTRSQMGSKCRISHPLEDAQQPAFEGAK